MSLNENRQVAESYRYCASVARRHARNFYFSFLTLNRERRAAMCAVYAFMRYTDDVADDDEHALSRAERIAQWRAALDRALLGDYGDSRILPAFHDAVRRFRIPADYFHQLIDGVELDLSVRRYETFQELYRYCFLVASVVGFVCLHVWGFDPGDGAALRHAESCGIAFQLTNILRDVKEDAERGRIYLPREDLNRFGVAEAELIAGAGGERLRELMRFEAERAGDFYERAQALTPLVSPAGRPTLIIMMRVYRGVLESIVRNGYDVYSRRARVTTPRKLAIVCGAWVSARVATLTPRK